MGNCKIDLAYEKCESQKEVKLDDNDYLINKLERNNNKDRNKQYFKYKKNFEVKNNETNNNCSKQLNYLNEIIDKLGKEKGSNNEDELVIITPRLKNNINSESYANEITDEFTIKNETLVYINDYISNKGSEIKNCIDKKIDKNKKNNNSKKISKEKDNLNKLNEKKSQSKKDMKVNNLSKSKSKNDNKNNSKRKKNISHSHYENRSKGQIIHKKNKSNILNQDIPHIKITNIDYKKINNEIVENNSNKNLISNLKQFSGNYSNQRKANNKKGNKVFNKSYNLNNNFGINPLFDSFQFSGVIKENNNPQSSTLEKQNIELGNVLLQNLPLINSDEIIPNIERKTYKEDLESSEIEQNNVEIIKRVRKEGEFNNKSGNMKIPIFKKSTDFHIRNKSYNKFNFFNGNTTNDNCNDNNYFSLFNNSANLSINFIHNKFNKSFQDINQIKPIMNNKNNVPERNNKSSCNRKVHLNNNANKNDKIKSNPFFNYNYFNKKRNSKKKSKNKSSNLQKVKQGLSNSKSSNNIFQSNTINKKQFNNTNSNINNLVLSSEQNSDMIELYIPKTQKKSLISNEIMNNAGNKYIFTFEKLDNFNTGQILYDGIIYKVIDDIENDQNEYKFLERYFQITKNSFKYFNNIKEAINEKEKPLVQFDVRHIQTIEIIDKNVLGKSKINENKNINILFCIYIKDNNDFFVFSHYNKYVGNNIINFLQFLIRYYEDNY